LVAIQPPTPAYAPGFADGDVVRLRDELGRAVVNSEFEVHYQPQVRLKDRVTTGAEALLRWRHPARGLIFPEGFISVLERSQWALSVGQWVIGTACADAAAAAKAGGHPLRVSINLSPAQFSRGGVVAIIAECLSRCGLRSEFFEAEIGEDGVQVNDDATIADLAALRELGCPVAFGGYGIGFASLSMLKRYPLTRLKIDQSFVRNIARSAKDLAIVDTVVSLGHNLGLRVTAQGIETLDQEELLRDRGCEEGQGVLYGRPVPISELRVGPIPDR
jgi:EAL domain-containing protein (putative c-di-GMP-specific phosphodiesterase class I)